MTELKPCPFCGSQAIEESGFAPCESIDYVFCSNSKCFLNDVDIGFKRDEWNTRAGEGHE